MIRLLKPLIFLLSLTPLVYTLNQVWLFQTGGVHELGADPAKAIVLMQGEWTIRFLMLTLLISPMRQVTGWTSLQRIRRMLGLFTFLYASLHLAAYTVFLLELDIANLGADILKRPYITLGFAAWALLLPLAATSTNAMMRRLGQRWQWLHRSVYLVALLAVAHLFWLSKSSYFEAVSYGGIVFLLLLYRAFGRRLGIFREALKPLV